MAIRLLWLTENYPPQRGGMAQSCDRLIYGLRSSGYEIEIIHFTTRGNSFVRKQQKGGGYTAITFEDGEPHTLNMAWNHIKTLGSFDYLIAFGGNLSMTGAPIFSRWMETRLITFLRGNDFDTSIFTARKREILQYALQESSIVFSVSGEKLKKINRWIPNINVQFVPNGIDLKDWAPTKSEVDFSQAWKDENSQYKTCIGLIGQLKPKKGVQFFINALSKTSLKEEVHLLLIGDIEEAHQQELDEKELSYTLIPFRDRYELMKYYLCCDALVIPSFYEGMPNVMLEAGSLGIPVIASQVDGMADVISHEQDGLLFQVGNEEACRKALYQFMSMKDQWKELGHALKTKIENKYTSDHEIEAYKKYIV
ncbi:MAG: glycosyltransferase family 4 protein [Bacteroidota bacterium]